MIDGTGRGWRLPPTPPHPHPPPHTHTTPTNACVHAHTRMPAHTHWHTLTTPHVCVCAHTCMGPLQVNGYIEPHVCACAHAWAPLQVNGYIEMKLDAGKLFNQFRRPPPKGAEDIGTYRLGHCSMRGSVCVCFRVLVCAVVHALLPDAVGAISCTLYLYTHLVA